MGTGETESGSLGGVAPSKLQSEVDRAGVWCQTRTIVNCKEDKMKELMLSLILWIGANSTLPVEGVTLPEIEFLSSEELHTLYTIEDACDTGEIRALYDLNNALIYLLNDWDKSNLIDRSFLLHELVHHLQKEEGYEFKIIRDEESYELQFMYLRESALEDSEDKLRVSDLFSIMNNCHIM